MRYTTLLLSFLLPTICFGQGIEFFQGSFDEAKELAARENKIIFVDAFTTWCGPCKRMAKLVFPQQIVGDYFNAHFVNLKLDMEKGEGRSFQRKYGVRAFPTLLFLDSEGTLVHKKIGGTNPDGLVALGKTAMKKGDPTVALSKKYEEGNRDPQFIVEYVKALSQANRPTAKVVNEYLDEHTDIDQSTKLDLLIYGLERLDSKIYDALLSEYDAAQEKVGLDVLQNQIIRSGFNTVEAAIEFETVDLLLFAEDRIKTQIPSQAKRFSALARVNYYSQHLDEKEFKRAVKSAEVLVFREKSKICGSILKQYSDKPSLLKLGQQIIKKDLQGDFAEEAYLITSKLQLQSEDVKGAYESINKGLMIAQQKESKYLKDIQRYKIQLEELLGS